MEELCIYCQGTYELEESDSTVPIACCSKECEEGFRKHEEDIEVWVESMKNN